MFGKKAPAAPPALAIDDSHLLLVQSINISKSSLSKQQSPVSINVSDPRDGQEDSRM